MKKTNEKTIIEYVIQKIPIIGIFVILVWIARMIHTIMTYLIPSS